MSEKENENEEESENEVAGGASVSSAVMTVERVTKVFALVGVLCYTAGLFVTNSYLQSLGVADFSALRIRFLYCGSVALFCLSRQSG